MIITSAMVFLDLIGRYFPNNNDKILKVHHFLTLMFNKVDAAKAHERRIQGDKCYQQSRYTEAIKCYSEAIMWLPQLTLYDNEMKTLYWRRAMSYLKEVWLFYSVIEIFVTH